MKKLPRVSASIVLATPTTMKKANQVVGSTPHIPDAEFEVIDDTPAANASASGAPTPNSPPPTPGRWQRFKAWFGRMWTMFWSWLTRKMKTPKVPIGIVVLVLALGLLYLNKQGVSKVASFSLWKVGIFLAVAALAWLLFWKISRDGVGSLSWPKWLTFGRLVVAAIIIIAAVMVTRDGFTIMSSADAATQADSALRANEAVCLRNPWLEEYRGHECRPPVRSDTQYVHPGSPLPAHYYSGETIEAWYDTNKVCARIGENGIVKTMTFETKPGVEDSSRVEYTIQRRPLGEARTGRSTCGEKSQ